MTAPVVRYMAILADHFLLGTRLPVAQPRLVVDNYFSEEDKSSFMKFKRDYRIAQRSLAHVKEEDRPWAVIEDLWRVYGACSRLQTAALLRRLTPGQRAFVALHGLEAEVLNGGIHQYLWNSTGNLFQEALAGLRLLGAEAHAGLLLKVARLFPDPKTLQNRSRRQKLLAKTTTSITEKLFDQPFYELEEGELTRLQTRRVMYLKGHPEEFVLPEGQAEETIPLPPPGNRDYRVPSKKVANLRREQLHWALIEKLWDDYWEPLKRGRQEMLDFLPGLSKGQRALVAIDILTKAVVRLGGLKHFLGNQIGADLLVPEVSAGCDLLGASPYADLFRRALEIGGDLPHLNRRVSEQSRVWDLARKAGDETAIKTARQDWRVAYDIKRKREDALEQPFEVLTDEFKALLQSRDQRIEAFIEDYFDSHPDEFVR
jgi:hypothetical protein